MIHHHPAKKCMHCLWASFVSLQQVPGGRSSALQHLSNLTWLKSLDKFTDVTISPAVSLVV